MRYAGQTERKPEHPTRAPWPDTPPPCSRLLASASSAGTDAFLETSPRRLYGDVIGEIGWSVGQIVAALEQHGLTENTLVVLTSDNGPWLHPELVAELRSLAEQMDSDIAEHARPTRVVDEMIFDPRKPESPVAIDGLAQRVTSQQQYRANIAGHSIYAGLLLAVSDCASIPDACLLSLMNPRQSRACFASGWGESWVWQAQPGPRLSARSF